MVIFDILFYILIPGVIISVCEIFMVLLGCGWVAGGLESALFIAIYYAIGSDECNNWFDKGVLAHYIEGIELRREQYKDSRRKDVITLSFKEFLSFYNLASNKYTLGENYVYYMNYIVIFKTYADWARYYNFKKNIKRNKIVKERSDGYVDYLKEVKKDLNKMQKKYNKITQKEEN